MGSRYPDHHVPGVEDTSCLMDNTFDMCGKDLLPAPNSPVNFGYSGGSPGRYIASPGRSYSTLLNSPALPSRSPRSPTRYSSRRPAGSVPGSPLRNNPPLQSSSPPRHHLLQNSPVIGSSLSSYSFSLKSSEGLADMYDIM